MRSFEPEEAAGAASAYSIEGHLWKRIGRNDVNNGVVQEVVGGSVKKARFNIMVFWAAPAIQKKFPAHFRVFKQVIAAINHEAIVEGLFSTAGRNFSKSRTDIGSQHFCEGIECASGAGAHGRRGDPSCIQATETLPAAPRIFVQSLFFSFGIFLFSFCVFFFFFFLFSFCVFVFFCFFFFGFSLFLGIKS